MRVVGDTELFDYTASAQLAARQPAGFPATWFPVKNYDLINENLQSALFTTFPAAPTYTAVTTAKGDIFKAIMMNLTGGKRPMFDQRFNGPYLGTVWDTFVGDGTVSNILNKQGVDTNTIVYPFDDNPLLSIDEYAFNTSIVRTNEARDANRLWSEG